jgi:phosphoribosylglycinamide formyltransferase-1
MSARLVVLISGGGSNLQAFIDAIEHGKLDARIVLVISNRPEANGLQRASRAGIPTAVVDHTQFSDRASFDNALIELIDQQQADAIILAGFMRILTETFVTHYLGKLFNIHPSLLPRYPGLHTHQRALEAGDQKAGATVHFVVPALDAGPLIIQASVPIQPGDSVDSLARRVLEKEHLIYPQAVSWFIEKRLQLIDNHAVLDGTPLPPTGFSYTS